MARFALHAPLGLRSAGRIYLPAHSVRKGSEAVIPYVRLYWIERGSGFIRLAHGDQEFRQGDLLAYGPGPRSVVWTTDAAMTYRYVTFDGIAMAAIAEGLDLPRRPVRLHADLGEAFTALGRTLVRFDRTGELEASQHLYAFLISVAQQRVAAAEPLADEERWTALATRTLERLSADPSVGITQVAARLGMHRSAFTRRFARAVGQAPKAYLDRVRLRRAIQLLAGSDQPIAAVACRSGFASGHGMAKVFKRLLARAPGAFRHDAVE